MKKQQLITFITSSFLIALLLSMAACNKSSSDTTLPAISTYNVISGVTSTSAQGYAYVTDYGGGALTAVGLCWSSANQNPTITDSKTSNSVDTAWFAGKLTGLTANTTYYVRGYATNSGGTAYGNVVKFKTNSTTFALTATVSTFAGSGNPGYTNGTGAVAQFYNPLGICADAQGNIYVADSYNNVIRKITPAGVTTTFAGNGTLGYVDGPAASAEFYAPKGLAADAQGNIYVSEIGNNMIRKISPAGVVSTLAGRGDANYADGTGSAAAFKAPAGIAVDAQGNVYVADRGNNVIRKITAAGVVTTLAGVTTAGQTDATGTAATFNGPSGVAVDSQGNVYVTDTNNHAIRKITSAGVVTTIIGNLYIKALMPSPTGVATDAAGNIYIADSSGFILELNAGGIFYNLAGTTGVTGFANGTNANAMFNSPQALTLDAQGNIYVVDYYNQMIRKITVSTQP